MSDISRRDTVFERVWFVFLSAATLGLIILVGKPALAGSVDCEKVRTGTDPIRITLQNTPEMEFKKPPQKVSYTDIIRNDSGGIVMFGYTGDVKLKYVFPKAMLLPLSFEVVGKTQSQSITYDVDLSTLKMVAGNKFSANSIDAPIAGVSTFTHHEFAISDGGRFDLAGCSFPVLSVHHTAHYKRDTKEWDLTLDSLVSTDLDAVLKSRRQVETVNAAPMESGVLVSVATDLSTTADMTKAP